MSPVKQTVLNLCDDQIRVVRSLSLHQDSQGRSFSDILRSGVKIPKPLVVKFYLLFSNPQTSKDIQGFMYRSAGTFFQEIIVRVQTLPLSCHIYD